MMLVELKLTNRINEQMCVKVPVCPNNTTSIWQPFIINCIARESRNQGPNSYFILSTVLLLKDKFKCSESAILKLFLSKC